MFICICKGITEEMLEKAISRGQRGSELLKSLGVGDDCGTCLVDVINRYTGQGPKKLKPKE